ncbi:cation diffusion facilitator family transporter [Halopseudomonas xinjiangensis]|uniref:Cation diffusion facilitator family transporter n=1 Tax=Halopseudomonas xinjiangensis TaxID=487184 RepID=A0A1H1T110_9GAMM|nr:cation diffusion facilitator family transporter [Halopseudomonas xinjiangensis]SDS53828.1 cation diffusion facilitator family transporter [Halopseudomonas xinjiangensis]
MDSCCENKAGELAQLRSQQSRVLYIVLAINAGMFLLEFVAGWIIGSTAVLADSLDMFGDASVYALTLYVLHRSARTRAGAALFKGSLMLLFGLLVIADAVRKLLIGGVPEPQWMGLIGFAALIANTLCFMLLYRHRSDDLNMKSTFLCSRNDLIANSSVIVAAVLVGVTGTLWPDVIVGLAIAALFLHSARQVLTESWAEWRGAAVVPAATASADDSSDCCGAQPANPAQSSCSTKAAPQTRAASSCCQPQAVEAQPACCGPASTDSCCEQPPAKGKGQCC